jgi:hypothetical protein
MQSSNNKKFVVEEVKIPDNQMQELNKILKSTVSAKSKSRVIRAVLGGTCSACFYVPTKKVVYDVGDHIKLVDYYCDPCFQKHKSELDKRLQNMNLEIKFQH